MELEPMLRSMALSLYGPFIGGVNTSSVSAAMPRAAPLAFRLGDEEAEALHAPGADPEAGFRDHASTLIGWP
jgi:hypothetical protein